MSEFKDVVCVCVCMSMCVHCMSSRFARNVRVCSGPDTGARKVHDGF